MTSAVTIARVLVGVDFDDASASALKMAGTLAAATDAELTVFHSAVLDVPAYFTGAQIDALHEERERSRAAMVERIHAFADPHVPRTLRVVVGEGPPQDAMLRMAPSFDLIVTGTHRRHGPQRWWLGSVAEAIVRHASRPVLVVPAGAVVPDTHRAQTILAVGCDDAAANAWVDALSTAFGGTVVRSPGIDHCTPDRVQDAELIVLAMPPAGSAPSQFDAIEQVLKECVHPVLFLPSSDGIFERNSS
jgi:nucleotide-binding universal stress UspA family protein